MSLSKHSIQIIIEYLEKHPERMKDSVKKLAKLQLGYVQAQNVITGMGLSEKKQADMLGILDNKFTEAKFKIAKTSEATGLLNETFKESEGKMKKSQKRIAGWSKSLMVAGWRVGWLSFRLVAIGKLIMRWLTAPVKKTIEILQGWEKSMDKVAMTLGLLEAQGMASGEMSDFLRSTMEKLPEVGLEFQAALGAIESVMIGIATDIGPLLSDTLIQLAEAFLAVWNEVSPVLMPALQELKDTVLPPLIDLIREMGPALVMAFVDGLEVALPLLIEFLNLLKPILPVISGIIGFLLPFAPLLILIGTALYFLSPILIAVSIVFKLLSFTLPLFAGGLKLVGAGLGVLGSAGSVAIPILLVLSGAALALAVAVMAVVAAIAFLTGQWGTFTSGIATVISSLGKLCFKHARPQVEAFTGALEETNEEMGNTVRDVTSLSRSLRGIPEAGVGVGEGGIRGIGGGGGPVTQYITIESPIIEIGNVSGEVDLDTVKEAALDGMSEAIRRAKK